MGFGLRAGITFFALLSACRVVGASSVFLRNPSPTPLRLAPVQTYAGKSDPIAVPIKFSAPVTVLLLVDTLSSETLESVRNEILALQTSLHGHPLRLGFIQNGSLAVAGPFHRKALSFPTRLFRIKTATCCSKHPTSWIPLTLLFPPLNFTPTWWPRQPKPPLCSIRVLPPSPIRNAFATTSRRHWI